MFRKLLFSAGLGGAFWFGSAGSAQAAPPAFRPMPQPPVVNRPGLPNPIPNPRPPGWDWWRTYPWSNYNAWRNRYWYYPYTPYVVPPYYYPAAAPSVNNYYYPDTTVAPVPAVPSVPVQPAGLNDGQEVLGAPHPTGDVKTPPPNAGLVRLELPSALASVTFNGAASSSNGRTRNYVTPVLQAGKKYQYQVAVTFTRDGRQVVEQRTVAVAPGQTSLVDFTR